MLVQCTKALLDKIGIDEGELVSSEGCEEFPNSFMAWHANFASFGRKKAIVLMNNETRYSIVIYRPTKKDFSKLKELIRETISEVLRMEGVRKEVIEAYLAKAGEISFSKTASRSMIAKMNNAVREVEFWPEFLDEKKKGQKYISMVIGRELQLSGPHSGFYPLEKMLECLSMIMNSKENSTVADVLDVDLYQLKIKINLEGHDIWRRVLVPSTFSFRHLHHIIQIVFDWQDYHLHEFAVERADNERLRIAMDDDPEMMDFSSSDEEEILQESFVALEDMFPAVNEIKYVYDFGDYWEHIITLEKIVKSNTLQATFLEGNGERPPEDVGGEGGFEEYLKIIENESHPMNENMKVWAEEQKERKLSNTKINHRLEQVTNGNGFSTFVI